jgi:chloramphenicol 3-O-phosphotransferase
VARARVIWLNGPFGVGKSAVAIELSRLLRHGRVVDPERIGIVLRRATRAGRRADDYQDLAGWRRWTIRVVALAARGRRTVIVPMTLVEPDYLDEIHAGLAERGVEVVHVGLTARDEDLRRRLAERGDRPGSWPEVRVERCLAAMTDASRFPVLVSTTARTPREVACAVLAETSMAAHD